MTFLSRQTNPGCKSQQVMENTQTGSICMCVDAAAAWGICLSKKQLRRTTVRCKHSFSCWAWASSASAVIEIQRVSLGSSGLALITPIFIFIFFRDFNHSICFPRGTMRMVCTLLRKMGDEGAELFKNTASNYRGAYCHPVCQSSWAETILSIHSETHHSFTMRRHKGHWQLD